MKSLLEVEPIQEDLIKGLVQALGATGSLEAVVTEEFYIKPVQQYIVVCRFSYVEYSFKPKL